MQAILVRHGESEGNQQGIIQGRLESPLTERGRRQSLALATALAAFPVAQVYTSPALRAKDTAGLLADQFACPLTYDERLLERHFGLLQGLRFEDAQREYPQLTGALFSGNAQAATPQGETTEEVNNRLFSCLNDLHKRHRNNTVIIVSHCHALEGLIWQLKGALMSEELRKYGHQNCSYSILNVEAECIELLQWGIATHLRDIR